MLKFNDNNILTGYIKQLLHSFNLPKCKVFNSLIDMKNYFSDKEGIAIIRKYKMNSDYLVYIKNGLIINETKYLFNSEYQNITTNLSLFNNLYDSRTHEYLGEYLRFLRDYRDLNLMSLYNCYSDNYLTDKNYKYILIPVKYNTIYSIAFDCNKMDYYFGFEKDVINIRKKFQESADIESKSLTTFSVPFTITTPKNQDLFKESLFKLIIRVPLSNNNPISIIEGFDLSSTNDKVLNNSYSKIQFNFDKENNYDNVNLLNYISNLELFNEKSNIVNSVPFADKLISYLTNLTIIPRDIISKNVIDAKYKALTRYGNNGNNAHIPSKIGKLNDSFTNNDKIRFIDAYQQKFAKNLNQFDILGYVDKDIEYALDDESRTPGE